MSFSAFSNEKVTTLHWGINLSPIEYFVTASKKFKQEVEKKTQGRVKVKLTIGAYEQDERNHLNDVSTGFYDMGQETVINLQKKESVFEIWNLPFLFKNNEHVFAYTDSKYGKDALKSLDKYGVRAVEYTYSGGFLYTFGEILNSLQDFSSKIMTFEESAISFKNFLRSSLSIDVKEFGEFKGEVKQSEIISSTINEIEEGSSPGFLRNVVVNKTEHRVFSRVLFINEKFLQKLSDTDRAIVLEEARKAAIHERQLAIKETDARLDSLKAKGVKINSWSEERKKKEKELFTDYYKSYSQKHGDEIIKYINKLI
jgi:TRAP-type C4-dicarboxylate transport system substrate-binding protein